MMTYCSNNSSVHSKQIGFSEFAQMFCLEVLVKEKPIVVGYYCTYVLQGFSEGSSCFFKTIQYIYIVDF